MRAFAVKSSGISEIDEHTFTDAAGAAPKSRAREDGGDMRLREQYRPRFVCERSNNTVSSWRLPVRVVVNSGHDQLLFVPVSAD
jgi:hypothetical protein